MYNFLCTSFYQWRIQGFPEGAEIPKVGVLTNFFANFFAENFMKIGGRGHASIAPSLDSVYFH